VRYVSSSITLEGALEYVMSARLLFFETIVVIVSIGKSSTRIMPVTAAASLLCAGSRRKEVRDVGCKTVNWAGQLYQAAAQ
jgi:hypothetical protein